MKLLFHFRKAEFQVELAHHDFTASIMAYPKTIDVLQCIASISFIVLQHHQHVEQCAAAHVATEVEIRHQLIERINLVLVSAKGYLLYMLQQLLKVVAAAEAGTERQRVEIKSDLVFKVCV